MKPLVAIETSGRPGSVALLLPDGSVNERPLAGVFARDAGPPAGQAAGHARTLVPEIAGLVDEAGLAPRDLGAVAVSVGPGSYTGLRVGVTAAKTLSWALSLELVAVSTLEALARESLSAGPPAGARRLVPAMDARRGQVYAALFEIRGDAVSRVGEDRVTSPEELARSLEAGDHVFGTATAAYPDELAIPEGATSAPGPTVPSASMVARLGREMLSRGETVEPHALAPSYLREWTSPRLGG